MKKSLRPWPQTQKVFVIKKKSTRKLLNSRCFTRRIANNAGLTLGKPAVVIRTNHSPNFKYLIPVINSKKRDFCSEPIPFIVQNIFMFQAKTLQYEYFKHFNCLDNFANRDFRKDLYNKILVRKYFKEQVRLSMN